MRFKPTAVNVANFGVGVVLTIGLPLMYAKELETITGRFKAGNEYELKQIRKKRSLDANSFFWKLTDEIAKALNTTKEQIYWNLVKRVGVFDTLQFADEESMNRFKANWQQNGLGWLTYTVDKDKHILQAYYGSSRYNTQEMSRLIDEAVEEAKNLGIETLTPEELSRMKEDWK